MANTVLGVMRARYRSLIATINSLEKQKENLAEGGINIKFHSKKPYYYQHTIKGDKYLSKKDTELIKQLIQKDHINKA